jgi:transcriptional regulator with XRE-family HTH domain
MSTTNYLFLSILCKMKFRDNLKAELTYKGMLVKELANVSGVNKRTIDNYLRENGSIPTADAAVSIARVLGVSVEYLITGHDHRANGFSGLAPDIRLILEFLKDLDKKDRCIVLDLVKSLKEREETEKGHK